MAHAFLVWAYITFGVSYFTVSKQGGRKCQFCAAKFSYFYFKETRNACKHSASLSLTCHCTDLYSQDLKASRCAELETISPCTYVIMALWFLCAVCWSRSNVSAVHCLHVTTQNGKSTISSMRLVLNVKARPHYSCSCSCDSICSWVMWTIWQVTRQANFKFKI
jgi:hypothetical protein